MHVFKPIKDCVRDFKLNMNLEWAKLEAEFRREKMELLEKHKKLIANGEMNLGSPKLENNSSESTP